jgi:glycosyltransferase involved in cell wall biosynthesis
MPPTVSVVMPVYQSSRFIGQAIESVQRQSWLDWELVIVDDGSTDDSARVAELLSKTDQRIRVFRLALNRGVAQARNEALKEARGRYIAFLDSDDLWDEHKLTRQLAFMRTEGASFAFTAYRVIDESGSIIGHVGASKETVGYRDVLAGHRMGCLTAVIDRSVIGPIEFPVFKGASDLAGWLAILGRGNVACTLNEELASYRVVANSISRNKLRHARRVWAVYRSQEISRVRRIAFYARYAARGIARHFRLLLGQAAVRLGRDQALGRDVCGRHDLHVRARAGFAEGSGVHTASRAGVSTRPQTGSVEGFPGGFCVLMAVYRGDDPALFSRAVESVYSNTLKPDQFVLVVDGPVPPAIEHGIGVAAERGTHVLRLPRNGGLASALNAGLAQVSTAWVLRADADDVNLAHRFSLQAEAIRFAEDEVDILGGAILELDRSGLALAVRRPPLTHEGIARCLRTRSPFNHMTVAYRAATVRAAGGYPVDIHLKEDYALWASVIARGARCRNLRDVLVKVSAGKEMYRRRGGLRYLASEWRLQAHLMRQGRQSLPAALLIGGARSLIFALPSWLRGHVYLWALRERPT